MKLGRAGRAKTNEAKSSNNQFVQKVSVMLTKIKAFSTKIQNASTTVAQKISAASIAPTESQARAALFIAGIAILGFGLSHDVIAQVAGREAEIQYNDTRISNAVNAIMTYLEGSFGALIMAASGVGAIMSAAFGQYKAALSLMVVAVGSFILRSLISTFFNDENVQA